MTVALITISPLVVVQQFSVLPPKISIPGSDVFNPFVGWVGGNYMLVDVATVGTPTLDLSILQSSVLSLAGTTLTITNNYVQGVITQTQLKSYVTSKQLAKAQSGTFLGQAPIPTDVTTLCLLSMAYTKSIQTSTFTMSWIGTTGPVTLTAANIQNAAQAVGVFLASCKALEATAINGINAATVTTFSQVDTIFA